MAGEQDLLRQEVITVGPAQADVIGLDNRAIQLALDAAALRGGGCVRVLPGEYILQDSIHLRSNVTLLGDRLKTVLRRAPMVSSPLAADADIGEKEITPQDASRFRSGMGILLRARTGKAEGLSRPPLRLAEVKDGKLYTNEIMTMDYAAEDGGLVVNYFAMLRGYAIENAVVDGFTVEAGADNLAGLEDVRIGGVWLTLCKHVTLRNLVVSRAQGDGILSEPSEHVAVEDCECFENSHHGIHFGSHSPWCKALRCRLHHNGSDGLYLCWGVREGVFSENEIHHNGFRLHRNGISLGHKDTDNLLEKNHVYENAKHGICFRRKTEANGAHRNVLRANVIENNGTPREQVPERFQGAPRAELQYCGIFVNGSTHALTFEDNTIRETRAGAGRLQVNAVYLGPGVSAVRMTGNRMEGHPGPPVVDESGSRDNVTQEAPATRRP